MPVAGAVRAIEAHHVGACCGGLAETLVQRAASPRVVRLPGAHRVHHGEIGCRARVAHSEGHEMRATGRGGQAQEVCPGRPVGIDLQRGRRLPMRLGHVRRLVDDGAALAMAGKRAGLGDETSLGSAVPTHAVDSDVERRCRGVDEQSDRVASGCTGGVGVGLEPTVGQGLDGVGAIVGDAPIGGSRLGILSSEPSGGSVSVGGFGDRGRSSCGGCRRCGRHRVRAGWGDGGGRGSGGGCAGRCAAGTAHESGADSDHNADDESRLVPHWGDLVTPVRSTNGFMSCIWAQAHTFTAMIVARVAEVGFPRKQERRHGFRHR